MAAAKVTATATAMGMVIGKNHATTIMGLGNTTTLVLMAEAASALIVDDADGHVYCGGGRGNIFIPSLNLLLTYLSFYLYQEQL